MSFIFTDKSLLNELIRIGQADAYSQQKDNYTNLLTLLNGLESQINIPSDQVSHEGDSAEMQIRVENLKDIGTLVNFLVVNKITVDDKRIAYSEQADETYIPINLEHTNLPNRNPGEIQFYVNKDLFSAYLMSLQTMLQKQPNAIISNMVSALVADSNNLLKTNIGSTLPDTKTDQKAQEDAAKKPQTDDSTTMNPQVAAELLTMRPFNSAYINFMAIRNFVNKYVELINDPNVSQAANTIDKNITTFQQYMSSRNDMIMAASLNKDGFNHIIKLTYQYQMANLLFDIVNDAGLLYNRLTVQFQNLFTQEQYSSQIRQMRQQVVDGGPWYANISDIQRVISAFKV